MDKLAVIVLASVLFIVGCGIGYSATKTETVTEYVDVIEYEDKWHNDTIYTNQTVPEYHNNTVWINNTVPEYHNNTIWINKTITHEPPIIFSGTGDTTTEAITFENGNYRFNLTHDGSSNFIVVPFHETEGYEGSIVNEIGVYDGSKIEAYGLGVVDNTPGISYLEITADGNWTIEITKL